MELSPAGARSFFHPDFTLVWEAECLPVTRFVFRHLSHQDADDATQDVAFRLCRIFPKKVAAQSAAIAEGRTFIMNWSAYTTTVCQHVLADFYKGQADHRAAFGFPQSIERYRATPTRHDRADDLDPLCDADFLPDPRVTADPVAWLITADLSALVRRTVATLPPAKRTVLAAHLFGATDKEASQEAGLTESTGYRYRRTSLHTLQQAIRAAGYDSPTPPIKGS